MYWIYKLNGYDWELVTRTPSVVVATMIIEDGMARGETWDYKAGESHPESRMTESEWLTSTDPAAMFGYLTGQGRGDRSNIRHRVASDRKLALFALACAAAGPDSAHYWRLWADQGLYSRPGATTALEGAQWWCGVVSSGPSWDWRMAPSLKAEDRLVRTDLLRHIVGNPWRPVSVEERRPCGFCFEHKPGWVHDLRLNEHGVLCAYGEKHCPKCKGRGWRSARSPWITPTVLSLAESLYAGEPCAFALHDALLEAGCPETVECPRNCWVLYGVRVYSEDGRKHSAAPAEKCDCKDGRLPHPLLEHFRPRVTCRECKGKGILYHDDEWKCHSCAGRGFTGGEHEQHPKGCWAMDLILGRSNDCERLPS